MYRTGNPDSGAAGFTLVELLVVLTIAAAALSLGLPLLSNSGEQSRARTTAEVLAADLRWLRAQAIATGGESRLTPAADGRRYAAEPAAGAERRAAAVVRDVAGGVAVALFAAADAAAPAFGRDVRFFPDGTSTGGRFEVRAGGRRYDVLVSWPFGTVRVRG